MKMLKYELTDPGQYLVLNISNNTQEFLSKTLEQGQVNFVHFYYTEHTNRKLSCI